MKKFILKFRYQNTGITLISLIITIIILLILAGISIAALTGNNGLLSKANKAKNMSEAANEKEAIELALLLSDMNKELSDDNNYYIGIPLYDRTQENGTIWNIIVINDTQQVYGTGWNFVPAGTHIEDFGNTDCAWLINYATGEIIKLEDNNYTNLDYTSSLAVTDNLILNIDPSNMSDNTSWGNNVKLIGVEAGDGFGWNGTEINLDGVNDYIEIYANDFEITEGITFEFYAKSSSSSIAMLAKTVKDSSDSKFSRRFRTTFVGNSTFACCMAGGGLSADSDWVQGVTSKHWIHKTIGDNFNKESGSYLTMTVNLNNDTITLYWNGNYIGETVCNHDWLVGGDLTDNSIPFTIGLVVQGNSYTETYSKMSLYSCRLYSKVLTSSEVKSNHDATVAYHNLLINDN